MKPETIRASVVGVIIVIIFTILIIHPMFNFYTHVKEIETVKADQTGYQQFGGKLWKCKDDPNDLCTVPCGPDDYSLSRNEILKRIKYNEDYGCPTQDSWQLKEYKREVVNACPYASACPKCGVYARHERCHCPYGCPNRGRHM